jgi:glutamate-1-semialdehyde 2,1-aminomutase
LGRNAGLPGRSFQAGTLSGNPLAMAAGNATLTILQETDPYDRLGELTNRLAFGLSEADLMFEAAEAVP